MNVMQQLLTEHIDIWTAAETEKKSGRGRAAGNVGSVYGIKKLRELILELAVRGKLVTQDANDEPASELLKRIQAEKAKLVAEGKIRKDKPLPLITEDEKPFELPHGWECVKFADVAYSQAGFAFKSNGFNESELGLPLIRIRDVGQAFTGTYFDGEYRDEFVVMEGDYLVSMDGEFRVAKWLNEKALLNQRVSRLIFFGAEIAKRFVAETLQAELRGLQGVKAYTTVDHLSGGQISNSVIALPPLAEQHRIVAKVDELMALCDQLEARHTSAADAHEKLVSHLLGTLTQSQNAADFSANWQRIAAHFDTLFTTEASIDTLKQTLLQLAVMGKLVPQDANDEPASELFNRITEERKQLQNEKIYQKTGKLKAKEQLKKYPENWLEVQIGDICPSVVPSRDKPKSFSGDIPWVTLPSFPSEGWYLDTSTVDLGLTLEEATEYSARVIPEKSVLMSCIGRFGLTAINLIPVIPNQQIHAFIILKGLVPEFLSIVIRVSGKQMEEMATSTTIAYLNKSNCESIEFGLPPSGEQSRIVAKVDELMALCDRFKSSIAEASQLQKKLAEVLVEHAVA